jgi:hypothetical protein
MSGKLAANSVPSPGTYSLKARMKGKGRIIVPIISIVLVLIFLFPLYWLVATSFKSESEIFRTPPTWFPNEFYVKSYTEQLTGASYNLFQGNGAVYTGVLRISPISFSWQTFVSSIISSYANVAGIVDSNAVVYPLQASGLARTYVLGNDSGECYCWNSLFGCDIANLFRHIAKGTGRVGQNRWLQRFYNLPANYAADCCTGRCSCHGFLFIVRLGGPHLRHDLH